MRTGVVGPLLLVLGVVVGTAAGVGLLVGFEPAQLPRALLNIAAYKLTFLAAGGLIAAGALVLKYGRRASPGDATGARASGTKAITQGPAPEQS